MCCVLSCFSRVQFFVTLWTVDHQAPLSMGFSWQVYWSGLPLPPPGDLPNSGMESISCVSCFVHRLFIPESSEKSHHEKSLLPNKNQ